MPPKTIWIPDELDEQLKKLEKLNVSGIAQEALWEKVRQEQAMVVEGEDFAPLVERLRGEKASYQAQWRERGKITALEWAKHASYGQIASWYKAKHVAEKFDPVEFVVGPCYDMGDYQDRLNQLKRTRPVFGELIQFTEDGGLDVFDCADSSFAEGWIAALENLRPKLGDVI